jgi:hypothetical protein
MARSVWSVSRIRIGTVFLRNVEWLSAGDALSIDLLLKHGASLHARDAAQLTPLHWAAVKGSRACISRLLRAGARLDAREDNGKTPADMAAELKAIGPWKGGLEDAGFDDLGHRQTTAMSEVRCAFRLTIKRTATLLTDIMYSVPALIGEHNQARLDQSQLSIWPLLFVLCSIPLLLRYPVSHSRLLHTTSRASIDFEASQASTA